MREIYNTVLGSTHKCIFATMRLVIAKFSRIVSSWFTLHSVMRKVCDGGGGVEISETIER